MPPLAPLPRPARAALPRARHLRRALALALALGAGPLAAGCGSSGGAAPITWLSPGTGEPNAAPLFLFRTGVSAHTQCEAGPCASPPLVQDAFVLRGGLRLLRQRMRHPDSDFRSRSSLFGESDAGVLWFGPESEPFDQGLLWVPREARVGLRWQVQHPALGLVVGRVVERADDFYLGPRVRWTIEFEFERPLESQAGPALQIIQRTFDPSTLGLGTPSEGHDVLRFTFWEGLGAFLPRVVSLDDAARTGPVLPDLPLTPLTPYDLGGVPPFEGGSLTSVVVPYGEAPVLGVSGQAPCYEPDSCPINECISIGASSGTVFPKDLFAPDNPVFPQSACYGRANPAVDPAKVGLVSHASGVVVRPSGVFADDRKAGSTGLPEFAYTSVRGLVYVDPVTDDIRLARAKQPPCYYGPCLPVTTVVDGSLVAPVGELVGPQLPFIPYSAQIRSGVSLGAPGEAPTFALFLGRGRTATLVSTRLEGNVLAPIVPHRDLGGPWSVTSDVRGRHLLTVSAGGRIDRVRVTPSGELVTEAVAHVEVPPSHVLTGVKRRVL